MKSARDLAPYNVETVVAAGSSQANATPISPKWSPALIITAGDDVVGVRLPPATKGKVYIIKNTGTAGITSVVKVYPATSDQINGLGTDVALSLGQKLSVMLIGASTTQWYTVPVVPS